MAPNFGDSIHMAYRPNWNDIKITIQRRLPTGALQTYISLNFNYNLLIWRADRRSFKIWRPLVPLEEFNITTGAHVTLNYKFKFQSYEQLHAYTMTTASLMKSLTDNMIWGEFSLSRSRRVLKIGVRSEFYALLRLLQPKQVKAKSMLLAIRKLKRATTMRRTAQLLKVMKGNPEHTDLHISLDGRQFQHIGLE